VETAGKDVVDLLNRLGGRAPLLHIKDSPLLRPEPMVALGDGKMDIEKVLDAGDTQNRWLIVELDRCARNMMEAVAQSLTYLTSL